MRRESVDQKMISWSKDDQLTKKYWQKYQKDIILKGLFICCPPQAADITCEQLFTYYVADITCEQPQSSNTDFNPTPFEHHLKTIWKPWCTAPTCNAIVNGDLQLQHQWVRLWFPASPEPPSPPQSLDCSSWKECKVNLSRILLRWSLYLLYSDRFKALVFQHSEFDIVLLRVVRCLLVLAWEHLRAQPSIYEWEVETQKPTKLLIFFDKGGKESGKSINHHLHHKWCSNGFYNLLTPAS